MEAHDSSRSSAQGLQCGPGPAHHVTVLWDTLTAKASALVRPSGLLGSFGPFCSIRQNLPGKNSLTTQFMNSPATPATPATRAIPTTDPYETLRPLMRRYGVMCSPQEFHWAVKQAYYTAEAPRLDVQHESLFPGLEPV